MALPLSIEEQPDVDVRRAVRLAREAIHTVFVEEYSLQYLLLEGVTFADENKTWHITFSFQTNEPADSPLNILASSGSQSIEYKRAYRAVEIDSSTGKVLAIRPYDPFA
jgi:hypothetical protein